MDPNLEKLLERRGSRRLRYRVLRLLTPPEPLVRNKEEFRYVPPSGRWNLYVGGAGSRTAGFINVDLFAAPTVDVVASVEQLPFADDCFTRIECDAVLEHVAGLERAMSELRRVLAVGGVLHVVVPFCHPFHEYPRDYRRFTVDGLRQLAADYGLEVVDAGWRTGPTATLLVVLLTYAKLWFTWTPLRALIHGVLGWLLFPLRYLDLLLFRRPSARILGNHCYAWLRRPSI